jgi:flagellum-specific ATP synthase
MMNPLLNAMKDLDCIDLFQVEGRVTELRGLSVVVEELPTAVGSLVSIQSSGCMGIMGEVVGFAKGRSIVMTLGHGHGIRPGDRVKVVNREQSIRVCDAMLGRVVNAMGEPIDGRPKFRGGARVLLDPPPHCAMSRARVNQPIRTGVRAIDLMTPLGKGQRMGIFAGPGVGKSTLLSQIARGTDASVNVIALIGERGREVREFIEDALGEEGRARSVVVVSTSDEVPLMRLRASKVACSIAEHFRDAGMDVMFMMDSVTRFAHAQRQVGLSTGEPPATRGYTPSVFSSMAMLLERSGVTEKSRGSITGIYTILVEGDDMTEPVADASRGLLDGHIVLSRKIASQGHYPAIDILDSVSRVASQLCDIHHLKARQLLIRLEAKYREIEELLQVGAYAHGIDNESDMAIERHAEIAKILVQGNHDMCSFEDGLNRLTQLADEIEKQLMEFETAASA